MLQNTPSVQIGGHGSQGVTVGGGRPVVLIAGPCVIESEAGVDLICRRLVEMAAQVDIPLIFKASFDKANRSSLSSFRGPGLQDGLAILARLRERYSVPVTTDIHLPQHAAEAAKVVDLLQVPAFLCRQTDLLCAAGQTGLPVNLKKGQFLAPEDTIHAVEKLRQSGAGGVVLTERGTTFGYRNLVVDMRSLPTMRSQGTAVCFDATHSVQRPGGLGSRSGGDRSMVPYLARGAVAVGVDALFVETHPNPEQALSDGPNMLPLDVLPPLLRTLKQIDSIVKGAEPGQMA